MDTDGLNSTPLVTVTQVDIYKENVVGGVFSDAYHLRRRRHAVRELVHRHRITVSAPLEWSPAVRNVEPNS